MTCGIAFVSISDSLRLLVIKIDLSLKHFNIFNVFQHFFLVQSIHFISQLQFYNVLYWISSCPKPLWSKNHEKIVKYAYCTTCIVMIKWITQKRDVFKIRNICQHFKNAFRSFLCQRLRMLSTILNYSTQGLSRDCLRIVESAQPLQECSSSVQTFLYSWLQVDLNDFSWVVEQCLWFKYLQVHPLHAQNNIKLTCCVSANASTLCSQHYHKGSCSEL